MSARRKPYPFDVIEEKWQAFWDAHNTFHAPNPGEPQFDAQKPKYYVLDMFPYPSGAGLHVGHPEGYTATDILARYKRMCGFNVLHPMGWDAFGLPAEQYAIKTGQHPEITTRENIARFRTQLKKIGFAYDWQREISTTDPGYYKWTQWIFLKIYNSWFNPKTRRAESIETYTGDDRDSVRLAYVAEVSVNWCPELGTVLANEEVIDGKSEVGGFPVERRPMRQWMLRITAYAERLIDELAALDWTEGIKHLQKNWIGRSEGAEVEFQTVPQPEPPEGTHFRSPRITVFTTRPDTLFGATYMVIAPEHPVVDWIAHEDCKSAIAKYRSAIASKSELDRAELAKEKTGVFTGGFAINPVNSEKIPVWIADYVLMSYGTGAIMAVPAHDERDFEFATKYNLPIREVVAVENPGSARVSRAGSGVTPERTFSEGAAAKVREDGTSSPALGTSALPRTEFGIAINSPLIDGLPTAEAKQKITDWLAENGFGKETINYKLRDWLFSRQRYWGEPFPIIWREGKHESLPEPELPLTPPPLDDFKPTGTGEPPLAKAKEWVHYSEDARRETNTMPQWAGSCWYYLRFCDPGNAERFVGEEAEKYWMRGGVDLYVGGTEHAVLHLLYARFWHKVLFDLGYVSTPEPFQKLVNQGIILGEDGRKMSKRWGNVIDPLDVIALHGADAFRLYEMFMGPLEQMKPWSMTGVEGVSRFLARVWRLVMEENQAGEWGLSEAVQETELTSRQLKVAHAAIKKVTADIETLSFNTAISQMMIFVNEFTNVPVKPVEAIRILVRLLNPFAPHMTEELWEILRGRFSGFEGAVADQGWPQFDEKYLIEDEIEIVVQVNGKVRDRLIAKKEATSDELEKGALALEKINESIAGKTIRKVVVVPGKLVNIVAV